jgi:hypothetical protein
MKILVQNYTFNASSGEITFTDYTSVDLESILLITNVTDNIIIYNFADPAKGGTVSGNVLTLDYDSSAMSNGDALQIFIEDGQKSASETTLEALKDLTDYLKILVNQTKTLATQDSAQRQRVFVDHQITTAVGSVVNIRDSSGGDAFSRGANAYGTNFALPDVWNTMELSRINYQSNIRSKLIF